MTRRASWLALRLLVAALLVPLIRPASLDVQRWLRTGDTADDPTQSLAYYQRAAARAGDSINLDARYLWAQNARPMPPADALVYLLANVEQNGWTAGRLRAYASLRSQLGDSSAQIALITGDRYEDIQLLRDLVAIDLSRSDWPAARQHLEAILAIDPADPLANYQLGLLLAVDEPERAPTYLKKAQTDVTAILDAATPAQLGLVLTEQTDWPFAEYALNAALTQDSQDWASYLYRGYVRDQRGKDGLSDIRTAIGLAPTSAQPYYFLGLHWRETDLLVAREAFTTAFSLEPSNPALAVEVALVSQELNDLAQAAEWFDVAVGLAPDAPEWHRLRAAFYVDTSYHLEDTGLEIIRASVERFPDDPHMTASLGYAYYLLGTDDRAQDYLERSVSLDPADARSQYYLGLVLRRSGDRVGAVTAFQAAVSIAGDASGYGYLASRMLP